ncbi:MAG TPA: glycosyltransferase family 1 protein [Sphingomicrobium sp.]|nr:glycosyltransferase family 1 protein [Sphingomicrobium sp.]
MRVADVAIDAPVPITAERPLRVALFTGNYNYLREGANQALNRLVAHLGRRGHQVRVYSPVTDTPAFEPEGTLVPVPSITLPVRTEFQLAVGIPKSIQREIERFAPDVVHVATPDILGTRAQTLAKRLGVPIVASLHTRFEAYLEHYGLAWLRPVADAHLRRFYRRADCVLAPTSAIVEEMKQLRGNDHAFLWSRGVDRQLFNPSRRDSEWRRAQGWSDDDAVALFFGRLVVEKGTRLFAEVVAELQQSDKRVRALVVGAGPAEQQMRSIARATFTGHLEGAELARAVASANLMISPSTTETFGNVLLEGMASGLPVITADAPNTRSLFDDGRTGILCRGKDDYIRAARRLLESPEERQRIGEAARQASEAYSWDSASQAAEEAYLFTLACRN